MNNIDSYRFGEIVINGKKYSSDVIIFPDKVRENWRRKVGHELRLDDITDVIDENPEVLLVGTGASGMMKVMPEVEKSTQAHGIKLIAEPTKEACDIYNQLCQSSKLVAAFHVTC